MLSTPPDSAIPDLLGPLHTQLWPILPGKEYFYCLCFQHIETKMFSSLECCPLLVIFKIGIFSSGLTLSHFKSLTFQNNKLLGS